MRKVWIDLALAAGSALLPFAAAAQNMPGIPTIDQSLEMKSVSNPRVSPDGRLVVYELQKANWEDNAFERELWIANTATNDRYQLTSSKKNNSDAAWSPDGKWVAFLSDRPGQLAGSPEGKRQLYIIAPDGGEARQITKMETGIASFEWAHGSRRVAFTSEDPEPKAMKDRKEKYGEYQIVQSEYTMTHLWVVELPEGVEKLPEPVRLTEGTTFTVQGFSWSPDGNRIAFTGSRDPDLGSQDTADIYVLDAATKVAKKIVDTKGPDRNPVWSPDGKQIAYETSNAAPYFYYANTCIAVVSAEGGASRILTEGFDEDPGLLAWAAEGIYFSALQKTYAHLYRIHPATKAIERISQPEKLVVSGVSFTRDYRGVAFTAAGENEYGEIYFSNLSPFTPRKLTSMADQFKDFKTARREVISWKSADGTLVEGILLKPVDFDPAKKYPLLVVIHGGPTGVDRPTVSADRYYPVERFVGKGALVLRPNYRGSAGYGEKFRALNVRNLGVGDYADVISGVDSLIAKGWVDKDRVGAMGWSQGGYISAFITASSDRFRAVSVGAGISDWMTYYVNTDIHPFTRQYLHGTPWDDPEIYRKTSPITYINKARTPTLIQHGSDDKRVPIPNAYELRQALEDRGVPVKMVVYKGFGHPINKPKQQRAVMEENYNWFSQWIWGEKPVEDKK